MAEEKKTEQPKVSKSAFKVTLGNLLSSFAGFGTQILLAALFGAGVEMDAYFTALVLPLYFEIVLVTGLSFVLIPAFVQYREEDREDDAWALIGTFFWLTAVALSVIAILGIIFSDQIIAISAPDLDAEKADLASAMLAVMMISVVTNGLGTLTMSIQNARNSFFWPAFAGALGSFANIAVLLILEPSIGAMSLAWGYLAFTVVRAAITVGPVLQHGWKYRMPLLSTEVKDLLKLVAPFLIFGVFQRSYQLFERFFASGLPDGELTYLGFGTKISSVLFGFVGTGIAAAIFPVMSRSFVKEGDEGLSREIELGLRLTFAIAFPALALLSVIAVPMIAIMYERGEFTADDTLGVSAIIPIVILGGVVMRMIGNVITRGFYVKKDTITAPVVASLSMVLYILLAAVMVEQWGYIGLALAQPLQVGFANLVLFVLLLRKIKTFNFGMMSRDFLLIGGASLAVAASAYVVNDFLEPTAPLIQFFGASIVSGCIYLGILFAFDRETAVSVLDMVGVTPVVSRARKGVLALTRATLR